MAINKNSVVLYEGASRINGDPIVVIATGLDKPSQNDKTGDMIQIFILRQDMPPTVAHELDKDMCICGNCPFRKDVDGHRVCYVNIGQSPLSAWNSYHNGNVLNIKDYPDAIERITSKPIRVGAYGDPAAFPAKIVIPLLEKAGKWTGYTHQWMKPFAQDWRDYLQASVETREGAATAMRLYWHYYRVIAEGETPEEHERVCLSNLGLKCEQCGICNGRTADMVITVHGTGKKFFKGE